MLFSSTIIIKPTTKIYLSYKVTLYSNQLKKEKPNMGLMVADKEKSRSQEETWFF